MTHHNYQVRFELRERTPTSAIIRLSLLLGLLVLAVVPG